MFTISKRPRLPDVLQSKEIFTLENKKFTRIFYLKHGFIIT